MKTCRLKDNVSGLFPQREEWIPPVVAIMLTTLTFALFACGAPDQTGNDGEEPLPKPEILSFEVDTVEDAPGGTREFTWTLDESDESELLECTIDATDDGEAEFTDDDCPHEGTWQYQYDDAGTYEARLTVANLDDKEATETVEIDIPGFDF